LHLWKGPYHAAYRFRTRRFARWNHVREPGLQAVEAQVLPPFEVIRSATLVNAELLNRTGELGVIAPGALADLLVVDGNPLDDLNVLQEQGKHLSLIMKGGKIYKQTLG
jgi:imidazolonepropionase-like amidohydrolase